MASPLAEAWFTVIAIGAEFAGQLDRTAEQRQLDRTRRRDESQQNLYPNWEMHYG